MADNDKIRVYGDISDSHEKAFLFIKGVYGCRNNGDAMEKMIEIVTPLAKKEAAKSKSVKPA